MKAPDLRSAVSAFLLIYDSSLTPEGRALLHELQASNEAINAWENFFKFVERARPNIDNLRINGIISRILEIHYSANTNAASPEMRLKAEQYHVGLKEAAEKLSDFFASWAVPDVDSPHTSQSAKELNDKIRACQTALHWAKDELFPKLRVQADQIFDREFPASQKRNQPNLAFSILMCREFDGRFGTPGYSLARALAAVAYRVAPSDQSIQKAYAADRTARLG